MRRQLTWLTATAILALAAASPAAAAPVTVGQLAPGGSPPICMGGPADAFNTAVAAGNTYVVPPGYTTVTSWSTNAATGAGQTLKLKVFRLVSGNTYQVVGHDGPRALTPSTLNTFPAHIAVQAGDIVGIDDQNAPAAHSACLFATGNSGDIYQIGSGGDPADGSSETFGPFSNDRINITATLAAPAGIISVSPSSGSTSGGTSVVLSGHDFTGASAVSFGGTPASSFSVNSDGQITAVAPPHSTGTVDISVTTPAGTTAPGAGDQFTYRVPAISHCVVPKLKHKTLKQAKKALKKAHCKLGKVKKKHRKPGNHHKRRVIRQKPKIGKILAAGAKVSIKLS